ncbi:Na+/H+ antiporter [Rhodococcus sp. X156]|uniref:Na+/H+ antiporter n=1 Tax=Rhodococcus sp. X156 TaxID=2499145 RepID=UPI000FDA8E90|nr:Na+/H+ antiporter [Rhodococcus sp. X156]
MTHVLVYLLVAVAVIVLAEVVADRSGLPVAALLTVSGLIYAALPGPNLELDPEVVLTFLLPPLLYSAALNSSLSAIRTNLRAVISLSVVLVLVTALLVGVGVSLVVPGLGLAAAVALGAAVAPPDPVAALSIGRKAGLPPRLITLIEGEGLLNDATALTTFAVAVTAATTGGFSYGSATVDFLAAAAGGVFVGVSVALLVRLLRRYVSDPLMLNAISLATPFLAYLLGEEVHVSGVLAVVIAGLVVGHDTPRLVSGASRLQTSAVWRLVDFLLEGAVFLLIGMQLPLIVRDLNQYPVSTIVGASVVTVALVLLIRPAWLVLTQWLPRRLRTRLGGSGSGGEQRLGGREVLVLSWAGTRGVITLAAIFSLPLLTQAGEPFPDRSLLLFCAYLVVLVTLVGQGVTFAPLVRLTGLRADVTGAALLRNEARAAAAQAGLVRLNQLDADDQVPADIMEGSRANLRRRLARYRKRVDLLESAEDGELPISPAYEAGLRARRAVIDAQRAEILRWRDAGRLSDLDLRALQRELDHEEDILPHRDR